MPGSVARVGADPDARPRMAVGRSESQRFQGRPQASTIRSKFDKYLLGAKFGGEKMEKKRGKHLQRAPLLP